MTKVILLLISMSFLMGMSRNAPPQPEYKISANPIVLKCVEYKWVKNPKFKE
jgi:hypothetical protein